MGLNEKSSKTRQALLTFPPPSKLEAYRAGEKCFFKPSEGDEFMNYNEQQIGPKIYVACLAAYNGGQLHGEWIDANQEAHEIQANITSMLERSPEPHAEEWAVHDYEGFGSISISEWPGIERVSTLAKLIVAHGEPFSI
jgi:hypothetical protein